jgi:hypothetical protein
MLRQRRSSFAIARTMAGLSLVAVILAAGLGVVIIAEPPSIIHPSTTTVTKTETLTSSMTPISPATTPGNATTTSSSLSTNGFQFITGSGLCTSSGVVAPCWGEPAYVFTCAPPPFAQPDETCGPYVPTGVLALPSYGILITSYHNQSEPWANCAYQSGFASYIGAYCVPLNSTAFIVGEPAPPPGSTSTVQSSEVAGIQVSAASVSRLDPQTGLNLTLNLAANANPYPTINIAAYDVNTLDQADNLTTPEDWPAGGGGCSGELVDYALYQGNYGLGNLTQGAPLSESAGVATCFGNTLYCIFSPLSTQATIYWTPGPFYSRPSLTNASVSASLLGYWGTSPANPREAYLVFPVGTYTVAAMDQWGNVVLSHFSVQG